MNPVTRQLLVHQEYEPEWEMAYNIQIRMCSILSLLVQWAESDVSALLAAHFCAPFAASHPSFLTMPYISF